MSKFWKVAIVVIIVLLSAAAVLADWENGTCAAGLTDQGDDSTLTTVAVSPFNFLFAGNADGELAGYSWSGTVWGSSSYISSGLPDVGADSAPTAFQLDGELYMIVGNFAGELVGLRFEVAEWVTDDDILAGLSGQGYKTRPVFVDLSPPALIVINEVAGRAPESAHYRGFQWIGDEWEPYPELVVGLEDSGGNNFTTYQEGGYLWGVKGHWDGTFSGWIFGESGWSESSDAADGLGTVFGNAYPHAYDDTLLLSGSSDGTFSCWQMTSSPPTPTPTATPTNTPTPTATPTPLPYLSVQSQNPESTPAPSKLAYYPYHGTEYIMCGDCVSYTTPLTASASPFWQMGYSIITNTNSVCIGVTPEPGGGVPLSSDYYCGYRWDEWDTGEHSVNIVLATATPDDGRPTSTPGPSPTPTATPTATPVPTMNPAGDCDEPPCPVGGELEPPTTEEFSSTIAQIFVLMLVGAADPTLAVVGVLIYGFGWLEPNWEWTPARYGVMVFLLLVAALAKGVVQERFMVVARRLKK